MINTEDNEVEQHISDLMLELKTLKKRKARSDKGNTRTKYNDTLPPKYKSYLNRANKKGISFELSVSDFQAITMHPCVYCGSNSKVGIDRINSHDGYTLDNSQSCCGTCNIMKYTHSHEEFLRHIKRIVSHVS